MRVSVSEHFVRRAAERMGYDRPKAVALGISLFNDLDQGAADFVGRVSRAGCRLFRFRADNGQCYYALLNTEDRVCVTVMPPGFTVRRQGKTFIKLKETDV